MNLIVIVASVLIIITPQVVALESVVAARKPLPRLISDVPSPWLNRIGYVKRLLMSTLPSKGLKTKS